MHSGAWVVVRNLGDSSPGTVFPGYPGFLQPDVSAAGVEEVGPMAFTAKAVKLAMCLPGHMRFSPSIEPTFVRENIT